MKRQQRAELVGLTCLSRGAVAAVAVEPVLLRGLYHNSLKDDELRVTQAGMACVMDRQAQPGETQRKQRRAAGAMAGAPTHVLCGCRLVCPLFPGFRFSVFLPVRE